MVRTSLKITSMALAAVLTFTGMGINAQAAGVSSVLPTGGINITLAQGTSLESLQHGDSTAKIEALLDEAALQQAREEAGIEVTPNEEDELKSLVIAQVNDYVNVRSLPSEEGEILGKLYNIIPGKKPFTRAFNSAPSAFSYTAVELPPYFSGNCPFICRILPIVLLA